jgi:PHD/YefM family antitoxin component YafN of YafNO toxin-antitoxin module
MTNIKEKITPAREIQRNYRKLVDQVKKNKTPVYLGAFREPEAVLLDIDTFNFLRQNISGQKQSWQEVEKKIAWIKENSNKISLSDFIHEDRRSH